jgi:hypothetical protein
MIELEDMQFGQFERAFQLAQAVKTANQASSMEKRQLQGV